MLASLVFLTPRGGLAMLLFAIPLVGLALAGRRVRRAREVLGLEAPPPVSQVGHALALVAVPLLLGLAATQPALRSTKSAHVRTDAEALFVVDVSRSMLASPGPRSATRFARAKQEALALRDAIPEVPAGIATLTDRVVPNLFPNPDRNVFAQTLSRALKIEDPPPVSSNPLATSLGALGAVGTQNFFGRAAKQRVLVVLTDGESVAFDPAEVAHDLGTGPGVKLVVVRVGDPKEIVFDDGSPEQGYHAHPESAQSISSLVSAADGRSFGESSAGAAAGAVQAAVGNGPTKAQGRTERTRTLAPYIALLALLPLLLVLHQSVRRGLGSALRFFIAEQLRQAVASPWKVHKQRGRPWATRHSGGVRTRIE